MIGQKVGDYRITELLGEGGMGVVFKGVHEALGQIVAIKMLHPSLMMEERIKSRFVREAQALARLNHPNIVRLLNFINREDTCFIVMEYAEGKTIEKLMHDLGVVPPIMAAEYFVQVLAAMHYAHTLGIIHRDIKPSNISVLSSGQVKLLDFGTAKMVGSQRLTQEGMTLGTLIYMSPEQICGRDLDSRSDIYSLGVTLYEMVTSKLPHYCEDEMELVRQIAKGVPQPPSVHYPFIPKRLEAIILKSIEKDPARRYQSADDFLKDLRAFMAEEKAREKKDTPPSGIRKVDLAAAQAPGGRLGPDGTFIPAIGMPETEKKKKPPVAGAAPGAGGGPKTGWLIAAGAALVVGIGGGAALALSSAAMRGLGIGGIVLGAVLAGVFGALAFASSGASGGAKPAGAGAGAGAAGGAAPGPTPPPMPAGAEATLAQDAPPPGGARPSPAPAGPAPVGAAIPGAAPHPAVPQPAAGGPGAAAGGRPPSYGPQGEPPPPTNAYIYAFDGPDRGRSWPLGSAVVTMGRGTHNTIILSDPGVSTTHAQIGYEGAYFVITDLQSRNGCYVNNQKVTRAPLRDRDVIVLGSTHIAVALNAPVPAPA